MNDRPVPRRRPLQPRLAMRLLVVLSIAILPLGLISVYQTYKLLDERRELSETALLERTQQAVSQSRAAIRSAVSTARTLAITIVALPDPGDSCSAVMAKTVEGTPHFLFAGFVAPDLSLDCSSSGQHQDLSGIGAIDTELTSRRQEIFARPLAFLGGPVSVNVTAPVFDDARFLGTVLVSVPVHALNDMLSQAAPGVDLVLFDDQGGIIATPEFDDNRRSVLPAEADMHSLAQGGRQTFRATNRAGQIRDYAIVPIVGGEVYALGSWEPHDRPLIFTGYQEVLALYFPFMIWAVAMTVAYIGVHRLVIRHVRRLRAWMRLYSAGHADPETARLENAPEELEVLAEAFRAMIRRLSEQERRLEEDLEEKTTLLREVHHRVKNNLQMISSIMNIQIRATRSPEARRLLRRVQDRIMALSAIHRYLYLSRKLSRVRADQLLDDIIRQLVVVGKLDETGQSIQFSTVLDPVEITPEQSVPLSLLATEAAMNAVKYCGMGTVEKAWINIALKQTADGRISLSVVNSRAADAGQEPDAETGGTGLGFQLIESFVAQLDGTLEIEDLPDRFELHVIFTPASPPEGED